MRWSVSKFFCCLVVTLQVIASVASAQGLMLCIHPDGESRIEDQVEQRACAEQQQQRNESKPPVGELSWQKSVPGGCVDLPMAASNAAIQSSQSQYQLSVVHFFAQLPVFLQIIVAPLTVDSTPRGIIATESALPDTVLDSLGSVVLVI